MAHGPHPRDHSMRVNKKMRKGALRSALTDALRSGKLAVVSEIAFDEPKTKRATELLAALELDGKVLVVFDAPTDDGAAEKSFRNLTDVRLAYAGGPRHLRRALGRPRAADRRRARRAAGPGPERAGRG